MAEPEKQQSETLRCVGCGAPMTRTSTGFCRQCEERGFGASCPGCEGISLLDLEEGGE